MWDAFKDYPMRRDYVEPDDFEYEPTAHDEVMKRAQAHQIAAGTGPAEQAPVAGREGLGAGQ
jgi:NADH-quinone oxidoreductase subunit C